jgi:membrane-associated protein
MELIQEAIDVFLHLDKHLNEWAGTLGPWLYLVLFLIVFCETGLVATPFLPGDSLLFAVGALAASPGSPIHLLGIMFLLCIAAVTGDAANYAIGFHVGPRVFTRENSWFLNKNHLLRTQEFYERHGGKTIFLARFVPIIRTFAPFVAGIGRMNYFRFGAYNVSGGITWVVSFLLGGYWFGNLPIVKQRFHYVILAIIGISLLPLVVEFIRVRRQGNGKAAAKPVAESPLTERT